MGSGSGPGPGSGAMCVVFSLPSFLFSLLSFPPVLLLLLLPCLGTFLHSVISFAPLFFRDQCSIIYCHLLQVGSLLPSTIGVFNLSGFVVIRSTASPILVSLGRADRPVMGKTAYSCTCCSSILSSLISPLAEYSCFPNYAAPAEGKKRERVRVKGKTIVAQARKSKRGTDDVKNQVLSLYCISIQLLFFVTFCTAVS